MRLYGVINSINMNIRIIRIYVNWMLKCVGVFWDAFTEAIELKLVFRFL